MAIKASNKFIGLTLSSLMVSSSLMVTIVKAETPASQAKNPTSWTGYPYEEKKKGIIFEGTNRPQQTESSAKNISID